MMLRRGVPLMRRRSTRSMSLLGSIFGIGEFEGAREAALSGSTGKQQAYDVALLDYVSMNSHPKFMLQQVLKDDAPFLMGHVLVGASQCLAPLMHQDSLEAARRLEVAATIAKQDSLEAARRLEVAATIAKQGETTTSEKLHVLALDAMVHGRHHEAAAVYETLLLHDHKDLLALRCCYDIYLFLGDYKNMLATVTRRLPSWSPNDAGYSHLLGMQAYGMQAAGRLDAAEALAEKTLSMNGNDRWALHTMLHVLEARGNANHGASYANQFKAGFDNGGPLERHLYFQWALYMLDLGHYDRIDKMLEVNIFPCQPDGAPHAVPTLCDATQLYWRLRFTGQDTTELGEQLLHNWSAVLPTQDTNQNESTARLHPLAKVLRYSILSCVTSGATRPVELLTAEPAVDINRLEAQLGLTPFQFSYPPIPGEMEEVYNSVCQGFQAYSEARFKDATQALLPVRGKVGLLGGTDVDQDVIEQLLIESASKCDDLRLAKLLLNERLSAKPQSAQCWNTFSRVSAAMGDLSAVRDAQGMSYVLGLDLSNKTLIIFYSTHSEPSLQLEDVIYAIKNNIDRSKMTSSVVTLEALESAFDTLLAVSAENDYEQIQVFGAFDTPRLHFNTHNNSYELRADVHRKLHAGPESRSQLLRNRFMSVDLRVKRNRLFAPPSAAVANTTEYMELSRIESLLGVGGVRRVVGMLGQDERKRFYLEDFTSRIIVDFSNVAYTDGLFTINCVVLVEGEVIDDVLHVQSMGFPPPETKEASLEVLGGIDPLGVEVSAQQREQIQELEANDHHATFIVLSDVHLDDPQVMSKLGELFQGLESVQPTLFILMGDFMSASIGGGAGSNSLQDLREYLEELGSLILKYPGIAENSRFVLVPGPNDPGSSRAFPRHPLPDLCTRDLIRKVPNVICTTNPCRIRYYTQDIVIFRDNLQQKMQRHAILPPIPSEQEEAVMDESDDAVQAVSQTDISKHLAKTLIDQAHLCPLPLMANPINWDFDSSLQLFPAPDVLILGDSSEQYQLGYSSVGVFHPGPFHADFSFVFYRPSTNTTEFSRVE
ncbi:DNA polymerase epsilon subunit [Phytophthora megakarya]|uniref:DNA polymerase II subunit 2 n=1 Tax=Phytophthora megakarya TaxID=4795 RepID=A0A225X2B1_9STRA|nr:DNA polymerase epsilon subunit [Phytophthora megakarya]